MHRAVVSAGPYRVIAGESEWPEMLASYREHAKLAEDFPGDAEGESFFAVSRGGAPWPELVVTQRYFPAGDGFHPELLIVPETAVVFIGAGSRLLAYALDPSPRRLWIREVLFGFWSWEQHGNVVVMASEVEIAAWSIDGKELWSSGSVDPPWTYEVDGDVVTLDVGGEVRTISLTRGV